MVRRAKKRKPRLPTREEMLQFVPKRGDFEWSENEEGLVQIKVPKFNSNFGKSFCKVVRKDNLFNAKMDKIGSIVWKSCDGKNTVEDILETVIKKFPNEENIENRLFLFIQQMWGLNYLI